MHNLWIEETVLGYRLMPEREASRALKARLYFDINIQDERVLGKNVTVHLLVWGFTSIKSDAKIDDDLAKEKSQNFVNWAEYMNVLLGHYINAVAMLS